MIAKFIDYGSLIALLFIATGMYIFLPDPETSGMAQKSKKVQKYRFETLNSKTFYCEQVKAKMNGASCINRDTVTVRSSVWAIQKIK